MNQIDLLDFTNSKHKIPHSYLGFAPKKEISRTKIVMAHVLDFYMAFMIFNMINILINMNLDHLLIAKSISFSSAIILKATMVAPIVIMSYFFFCMFFNHGQTMGMKTFKLRIVMPELSIKDSFHNSFKSILNTISFGLSKRFIGTNIIKEEDYLYSEFMVHKDIAAINLLDEVEKSEIQERQESESFQIAA